MRLIDADALADALFEKRKNYPQWVADVIGNMPVIDSPELLKQEPVKPKYNARTNWYECGACHYSMTSGMHCHCEIIPSFEHNFCSECGRPVDWSDYNADR